MRLKIFCFFILSIFACSKVNQWKQPTKICFSIDLLDATILDGKLTFDEGYLMVESFKFDGKRTEGADVYFTKHYTDEFTAPLGIERLDELSFDVPQGIYQSIDVELVSKSSHTPNLVINGTFKNKMGLLYPVRFELAKTEVLHITGEDLMGNDKEVDLAKITKTKATILLDPAQWFSSIQGASLEQAEKSPVGGQSTILITKTINQQLYEEVVAKLEREEQKAVFVKQS
ncbi:hypothetical protein [Aureispira anguillae]|uniref:Lipoprotein n=1 Tax=Aureispira anguillae TaxID=2864201 RepID=A0A916DTZ1_9BACT|nr:hypothetical protein [Aureispira anguillae]BDS12222.1 hypothetical protein AsAng_0029410 [Aureispira anguillae]